MPTTRFYLRTYPEPDDIAERAAAAEDDGWDGLLFTDSQNLSMDVVASLHRAAAATGRLLVGTAVSNLSGPAVDQRAGDGAVGVDPPAQRWS